MTDKIVVFTTCSSEAEARRVAARLLDLRLAACVSIQAPCTSLYHWQGKLEESTETPLTIKTRRDLLPALSAELARVHSYEVPEILALPVVDGSPAYLDWLDRELAPRA